MLLTAADCPTLTPGRKKGPAPEGARLYWFAGSGVSGVDFMALTVEGLIAGWMLTGASVPGQRYANEVGGPDLVSPSAVDFFAYPLRSVNGAAIPVVKHPVAP